MKEETNLTVLHLEEALDSWQTFGDNPAKQALMFALDKFVECKIVEHITNGARAPFISKEALSDTDYEALLKPGIVSYSPAPRPVYIGYQRQTCATCGSLMVQGLCSNDAAHYQ
jgi:hypothetical protein